MGKMGQINDPEVQAAIATVTKCCRKAKIPLGIFADSAESAARFIQQGYTLIAVATDCLHMIQGAAAVLKAVKSE
jgi:2-keto-3-deoxy-L-rhamnonate aldolase RhmA